MADNTVILPLAPLAPRGSDKVGRFSIPADAGIVVYGHTTTKLIVQRLLLEAIDEVDESTAKDLYVQQLTCGRRKAMVEGLTAVPAALFSPTALPIKLDMPVEPGEVARLELKNRGPAPLRVSATLIGRFR